MKIVIPGGRGQVGVILARHFHSAGHQVIVLSRQPRSAPWTVARWDGISAGDWVTHLESSDVCINLTGRSVNCRYNARNRSEILRSRIDSTLLLNQVITGLHKPPRVWINASTATIYRHATDRAMDDETGELGGNERDAPDTWKFSISVAKGWEEAFFRESDPAIRKVAIRSAMIFSPDAGGVFDVFLGLVRHGLGGTQGSGRQYVSWIHDVDFIRAIELLIDREDIAGTINLASPNPLPNREFMTILRGAWGMNVGLSSPGWILEFGAMLMRTESELVLKSRRVVPSRLLRSGFRFEYGEWSSAAKDLVARWRQEHRLVG